MTTIPLLSGILASEQAQFGTSVPLNLEPLGIESGVSKGMLHTTPGVRQIASSAARDRGGIVWQGQMYRVIGADLGTVDSTGTFTSKGTGLSAPGTTPVILDYGPNYLMVQSANQLWLYDGTTLKQITDPDLGPSYDAMWIAGYFMSTDGNYITVTDLADSFSVNPLKYASAESDPDPIVGLLKLHDQAVVLGANTVQFFANEGGSGFPFAAQTGATIQKGCVGRLAKCLYAQGFAFAGGGRNEATGVYFSQGGVPAKLSTRAVDDLIAAEPDQANIKLEAIVGRDEQKLFVHLSDKSLIYLKTASEAAQQPVWTVAYNANNTYVPRNPVLYQGQWYVGHISNQVLGVIDETTPRQFGLFAPWRFDTQLIYNEAKGGIIHEIELVGLPGRYGPGEVRLSFTEDGETYTLARPSRMYAQGARTARVKWRPHKRFRNYIGLRFEGDSSALAGWASIEADIEGLSV